MSSYLVTGAAGFIGSALVKQLVAEGHRVVTIDNLSTGFRENIPNGVEFYRGDCQDEAIYQRIPQEKYDAIFHIAGQSSGEISFDDPSYDLRTNTESTLHLLKFALSVGCSRFIYCSSMSVYGIKPDRPIKEDEVLLPESFYGVGKLASEHYLRIYEQYGVRSTSLRLFNVYGPGQNMVNLRQGMVSIYMQQMLKNNHIVVKGNKDRYRDFVYIDDVVAGFMKCLESDKSCGKIINIAAGKRITVERLLDILTGLHNEKVSITYSGSTPGDLHGIYADITLATRLLEYYPTCDIKSGLTRMLNWAYEQ